MNAVHLLIETSGRGGFVGLARDGGIVKSAPLDEARRHARDLAENVRRILEIEKLTPKDVASVLVSVGPGSYTGLRVGLVSAKAFAFAVGCPLVAVPTFQAIVERTPAEFESVHVIADGLQGLIYVQRFKRINHEWRPADELRIVTMKDWHPGGAVTGPGIAIYDTNIANEMPRVPEPFRHPTLEGLWLAGRKLKLLTREEMYQVEPLYLRGSSAEEKRKAQSEPVKASSAS